MLGIVSVLKESKLFTSVDIIELIDEESVRLLKLKAKVLNGTLLYVTELHTADYQRYSYHWQKANGEIIIRWDNKPHWKDIKTFPHHKHANGKVLPSNRISIDDVLEVIKKSQ